MTHIIHNTKMNRVFYVLRKAQWNRHKINYGRRKMHTNLNPNEPNHHNILYMALASISVYTLARMSS